MFFFRTFYPNAREDELLYLREVKRHHFDMSESRKRDVKKCWGKIFKLFYHMVQERPDSLVKFKKLELETERLTL